jgi:putative two-component system response regulator
MVNLCSVRQPEAHRGTSSVDIFVGLSGHQIPITAQLFSIVDVWDAVTNDRVYRKANSREEAWKIILAENGKAFNPQIVPVFLDMIDKEY